MAGIRLTVSLDDTKARTALRYLRNLAEDPAPLLDILGDTLVASTQERFIQERGPTGMPWPKSRRAAATGGRSLYQFGHLFGSIRHQVRGRSQVEIGVDGATKSAKFAYVQQFGATIVPRRAKLLAFNGPDGKLRFAHKVTIPARPFLGINAQDKADVGEHWFEYVRGRLQ